MIYGIGIDIVDVSQVFESCKRGYKFKKRIFTPNEISYCEKHFNKAERYAAHFAAKEAFVKAMHLNTIHSGIKWHSIELIHTREGFPEIILYNKYKEIVEEMNIKIHISISHIASNAIAYVILEI